MRDIVERYAILSVLVIALLGSSCQSISGEARESTTPATESEVLSQTSSESQLSFEASIGLESDRFLPGEEIRYGIGIINSSSGIITIDPFPPAMWVKPVDRDEPVYSLAAGNRTHDILPEYPESWYHPKGSWGQKDYSGQQVSPGWYEIGYEYVIIERKTGEKYTANLTAKFQIVRPDSAMFEEIKVNRSVTAEGITITLERIELNPVEVKVYTFTAPPGYSLHGEYPPEELDSLTVNSRAEYSVDGGIARQIKAGPGKADDAGITLTWDEIEPVPVGAKEFTFTITRLGDWEGPWEFRIPLE
jgi:hypothetical protein